MNVATIVLSSAQVQYCDVEVLKERVPVQGGWRKLNKNEGLRY